MNYFVSLHQSCGWHSVVLPTGDIFVKAFSALSFSRNSPKFNAEGLSGHKTPMRAYTHPIGGCYTYRYSVGWAVYFRDGCLAIP